MSHNPSTALSQDLVTEESLELEVNGEEVAVKKKKKKKKKQSEEDEEEESHIDPIPIVCAVMIASVFGGPVCLIANLKLGMFAAIGGGIMGYTTGRMFSDHGYGKDFYNESPR